MTFIKNPTISVVIPVFKEEAIIEDVVLRIIKVLVKENVTFEIILVDDFSTDRTVEVISDLMKNNPYPIQMIRHPYNKGNGAAIKTGIKAAAGKYILCMDADGQHRPEDIKNLLPFMSDYELVVGSRKPTYKGNWYRDLGNHIYNKLASLLTDFDIQDLTSGFRLFNAPVVKHYARLFPNRFSYPTTSTMVFLKAGYSVKYVPVTFENRKEGHSQIRVAKDGWKFLIIMFKILILFEPLRVFIPLSLTTFFLALLSTIYNLWLTGIFRITNTGVVLVIVGLIVLLLGFISEQIASLQTLFGEENINISKTDDEKF